MHEHGKSDKPIVPKKSANEGSPRNAGGTGGVDRGKGFGQGQFGSANQDPSTDSDIGPVTSAGPDTRRSSVG